MKGMSETQFRLLLLVALTASVLPLGPARAWEKQRLRSDDDVPFNRRISNVAPLAFGMDAPEATRALGVPLIYVKGRSGNETFLVIRDDGGSGFFRRNDRMFLQFRGYRLTAIKGDWGHNWMWR